MAGTCLNNILEVSPETTGALVENQGLDRLFNKLMHNDMTEAVINCLEKVSLEYSNVILAHGGLENLMNVIDFLIVQSQVVSPHAGLHSQNRQQDLQELLRQRR